MVVPNSLPTVPMCARLVVEFGGHGAVADPRDVGFGIPMTSFTWPGWMPAPWVAFPRDVMDEVDKGKRALVNVQHQP